MLYNYILLLPSSVCLFWAILLFCKRKNNSKSQNILSFSIFTVGFFYFIMANYMSKEIDFSIYYKLDSIDAFITLWVLPSSYLYFKSLTDESQFSWKDYTWFIPSIIIGTSTLLLYLIMGEENAIIYTKLILTANPLPPQYTTLLYQLHSFISIKLYNTVLIFQWIYVVTYSIFSLIHYHRRLREQYSALEDKSINLNYVVLTWFMISMFLALILLFTGRHFWQHHQTETLLYCMTCSIVYFCLCYFGSQVNYTVEDLAQDLKRADNEAIKNNYVSTDEENENIENSNEIIQERRNTRLLNIFNKLIEEDKVFLQNSLRADELAQMMRTNRTYISRLFKEEFHCTFSDYINNKRIEFSKNLMLVNPDMKQDLVAEKSGFLSASSFSKVFKQTTKMTPKEWSKKEGLSL